MAQRDKIAQRQPSANLFKLVCTFQVYELALFAEDSICTASLQSLKAQGFFRDLSDQTCCAALSAGGFKKMLVYHMLRSVTRAQFVDRLLEDLRPRLQKTGDEGLLPPFISYFNDKSFEAGTQFLMLWTGEKPAAQGWLWLVIWD